VISVVVPVHNEERSVALLYDELCSALEPLGRLAQLDPDLLAREQPRLGSLGQRHPRAHEQRLHARDRRVHRLGDLVIRESVDLAQQQRRALGFRKILDVRNDLA